MSLAQDRRTVDQNGHLRVPDCRISKATVNPYFGYEIPGSEAMGLNPNRVYYLYRDPQELRRAAETFDTVPLLNAHIPVTADAPAQDSIAGTVSNVRFESPYLVGDVTVWRQDAIDAINDNTQRELSCAYMYTPEWAPGITGEGLHYDIIMRNLKGNHVALVSEGRAGPDVLVADGKPIAMKFKNFLEKLLATVGAPATPEQKLALDSALSAELEAMDSDLTDEEKKSACDSLMKELGKDSLTDEEKSEAYARAAKDKKARDANPEPGKAMDAAVKAARDEGFAEGKAAGLAEAAKSTETLVTRADADKLAADAATAARAEAHALYAAREAVAEKCGVIALDSAEAVYRAACDKLKIDHKDVPAAALAPLYARLSGAPAPIAADAAPTSVNIFELFPGAARTRRG